MESKESRFFVSRNMGDRRMSAVCQPPYLTEEGMVMIDRRESAERRETAGRAAQKNSAADPASNVYTLDLA